MIWQSWSCNCDKYCEGFLNSILSLQSASGNVSSISAPCMPFVLGLFTRFFIHHSLRIIVGLEWEQRESFLNKDDGCWSWNGWFFRAYIAGANDQDWRTFKKQPSLLWFTDFEGEQCWRLIQEVLWMVEINSHKLGNNRRGGSCKCDLLSHGTIGGDTHFNCLGHVEGGYNHGELYIAKGKEIEVIWRHSPSMS